MIRKVKRTKPLSPDNIFISGDINCQSYRLMMKIEMRKLKNSHIIVLGNFGIGTLDKSIEEKNLFSINRKLKSNSNKLYLIRGNLDNEKLFDTYSKKYRNIIFIEDYKIITIEGMKFMSLSGSETFDRAFHFNHKRNKPTAFREFDMPNNPHVDVVLSHDNVDFIHPYNLYNLKPFTKTDKWLYNDIKKKRKKLTSVYESLKDKKCNVYTWYSSKYNNDLIEIKNSTKFIQIKKLDIVKLTI